jgi:prevent-host-death family protein
MARQVTTKEAEETFLVLLEAVERGEELEITRHGRPVARLIPARVQMLKGSFEGVAMTACDERGLFSTGACTPMLGRWR